MFFTIAYAQFIEIETNTSLKYFTVKLMHMVLWIIVINNQSGEA